MRGKDVAVLKSLDNGLGSPPLARERPLDVAADGTLNGITPACAGKTHNHHSLLSAFGDHPRLRGKDQVTNPLGSACLGSPPLARERRVQVAVRSYQARITPACAGKTFSHVALMGIDLDHPRLRGKDPLSSIKTESRQGSPPLARERREKCKSL